MINTNELMLGNYVRYKGKPRKVESIYEYALRINGPLYVKRDNCEPIPITEEILEKCGYKFDHQVEDIKTFKKGMRYATLIEGTLYADIAGINYEIKSLHQFQNLYFLDTGKQLEINL